MAALYAARAAPSPAARAARLAPLYAPGAVFSSAGGATPPAVVTGARAVLAALASAEEGAASLGVPPLEPLSVDVSPPVGGVVAVLVAGASPGPAPGPLGRFAGAGAGASASSSSSPPRLWAEALHLAPCPAGAGGGGELRIVWQAFRWLCE